MHEKIITNCLKIKGAYENGLLGNTTMPEDTNPFSNTSTLEERLLYFSLPMSLNYQRDSYKLWETALKTWDDKDTHNVFVLKEVDNMKTEELREKLLKYKLALQPNKHINNWQTISLTVLNNWGSFENLLSSINFDFLKLKNVLQKECKKGFPYLSGPKIFNYWSYILQEYCDIELKNSEYIEIAPDTHVIQASIKLGIISKKEAENISREKLSLIWRNILKGSGINPIDMHSPLWFWSRNGFKYEI